jgi:signal transduction histidine kinase
LEEAVVERQQLALIIEDERLRLRSGISPPASSDAIRLGLVSMKERAALAGGSFEMDSAAGGGTRVRAVFPMRLRTSAA